MIRSIEIINNASPESAAVVLSTDTSKMKKKYVLFLGND